MNLNKTIIELLEDKLAVSSYLEKETLIEFYAKIAKYLQNRTIIETFSKEIDETIKFFSLIGFSNEKMIKSISNWPAIFHANKDDMLIKYMMMAKLVDGTTSLRNRDEILECHPKDFMISKELLFARISYLEGNSSQDFQRNDNLTRRKVLKITNDEFTSSYGISKKSLLEYYPLTIENIERIKGLEENKELVSKMKKEEPNL